MSAPSSPPSANRNNSPMPNVDVDGFPVDNGEEEGEVMVVVGDALPPSESSGIEAEGSVVIPPQMEDNNISDVIIVDGNSCPDASPEKPTSDEKQKPKTTIR